MRLLVDTGVLLDLIADRPASRKAWNKLNALELTESAELWVAAPSYDQVQRQLSQVLADEEVRSALRATMGFVTVCSVDGSDIRFALDHADLPYDAALVESCARKIKADYLVTNDGPLDVAHPIRRVSPDELFEDIEVERGIVFDLIEF